jgi:hypothetical protein
LCELAVSPLVAEVPSVRLEPEEAAVLAFACLSVDLISASKAEVLHHHEHWRLLVGDLDSPLVQQPREVRAELVGHSSPAIGVRRCHCHVLLPHPVSAAQFEPDVPTEPGQPSCFCDERVVMVHPPSRASAHLKHDAGDRPAAGISAWTGRDEVGENERVPAEQEKGCVSLAGVLELGALLGIGGSSCTVVGERRQDVGEFAHPGSLVLGHVASLAGGHEPFNARRRRSGHPAVDPSCLSPSLEN